MKHGLQPIERAMARIQEDPASGCWVWTGGRGGGRGCPYGVIKVAGRCVLVHRLVYEALVGPVPEGLTLDHLCRNTLCSRPDHLEPVTNRENTIRGVGPSAVNSRKASCDAGHPLSGYNLVVNSLGARVCRTCARATAARYRQRIRAEAR